jgi:hypothetical protein
MAQSNCMTKYPDHSPANDALHDAADTLEFPVAPNFLSHPPRIEAKVMLRRIAENLPWRNSRPGEQERRLADKISVEFVL